MGCWLCPEEKLSLINGCLHVDVSGKDAAQNGIDAGCNRFVYVLLMAVSGKYAAQD